MKSFIFGTTFVLLGAVGATAQVVDSTDRDALDVTPEREVMEEPAVDPATPSEFERGDMRSPDTMQVDSTSLSPEDGDPQTSRYHNPQPARQPAPNERVKPQRPNGVPE